MTTDYERLEKNIALLEQGILPERGTGTTFAQCHLIARAAKAQTPVILALTAADAQRLFFIDMLLGVFDELGIDYRYNKLTGDYRIRCLDTTIYIFTSFTDVRQITPFDKRNTLVFNIADPLLRGLAHLEIAK